MTSAPVGDLGALGTPVDDLLELTGSALAGVVTDTVTLSDFTADPSGLGQFAVGEVTVAGTPAPVTAASLCALVRADAHGLGSLQGCAGKAPRRGRPARRRRCQAANRVIAKGTTPAKKARLVADFKAMIKNLRRQGWLTADEATAITAQADRL